VHGAELKGVSLPQSVEPEQVPLFGAPEDYNHLSAEEKQQKTEKMMSKHKVWSSDPFGAKTKTMGV
jgi:hypothetical protein